MDPFSAIGLAANILQLIDFSHRLVSDAKEIYHSTNGVKTEYLELQGVAESLSLLSSTLTISSTEIQDAASDAERQINMIAASSKAVADKLLATVEKLRVHDGPHRKWRSFRQALNSIWVKDDIKKLQKRLEDLRSDLALHVLSHISIRQSEVLRSLQSSHVDCLEVDSPRSGLIGHLLESIRSAMQTNQDISTQHLADVDRKLLASDAEAVKYRKEMSILKSLVFDRMTARQSVIVEAHSNTFDWIFEPSRWPSSDPRSRIRFHDWLTHGDGIYWISGKPGSGKSTLMKYLLNCQQTKQCLHLWSTGNGVATAGFFFWIAGTEMQKSQCGLLQQLLFEILKTFPEWIPIVCPKRWERSRNHHDWSWSLSDLMETFQRFDTATENLGKSTKLCLFIDGLDEYNGDHLDLIKTVNMISQLGNVKVCVSSRPWNCFEDAFGQNKDLKLYLQELTMEDMTTYTRDKLVEVPGSSLFTQDQSQIELLVSEIVHRAQGVFLWVFLVARSLRQGLVNGDSFAILYERLMEMPSDLEEFFEKLIRSVDTVYRRRMAYTFQVALNTPKPLRLFSYSFIDEGNDFSKSAFLTEPLGPSLTDKGILVIEEAMNRQLNGRYKGLLESNGCPGARDVDFLHRTVRDFLATKGMQGLFASYSEPDFNASACVCNAFIMQAKRFPGSLISAHLDDYLFFAHKAEEQTGTSIAGLLEGMDHVFHSPSSIYRDRLDVRKGQATSVLGKAIEFGLTSYVRTRLERDSGTLLRNEAGAMFLAFRYWFASQATKWPYAHEELMEFKTPWNHPNHSGVRELTYEMAALLLAHGADANVALNGRPVLHMLLDSIDLDEYFWLERGAFQWYCRLLLLLLKHGARFREKHANGNCVLWTWFFFHELDDELSALVLEIFDLLMDNGLRPDTTVAGLTLWAQLSCDLLDPQLDKLRLGMEAFCWNIMKLFLRKGADPHGFTYPINEVMCMPWPRSFLPSEYPVRDGPFGPEHRIPILLIIQYIFTPGSLQYDEAKATVEQAIQQRYQKSSRLPGAGKKRAYAGSYASRWLTDTSMWWERPRPPYMRI